MSSWQRCSPSPLAAAARARPTSAARARRSREPGGRKHCWRRRRTRMRWVPTLRRVVSPLPATLVQP
eukprot:6184598-Prymnesium_polylepis.1